MYHGTPYDDDPPIICEWCHLPAEVVDDKKTFIYDEKEGVDFCSKACQEKYNDKTCIRTLGELCKKCFFEEKETQKEIVSWINRRVYKGTSCGAWFEYAHGGHQERYTGYFFDTVTVGSIVEGVDEGAEPNSLTFPFLEKDFWGAVDDIENQCSEIWNNTHGCEQCPMDVYECFHIISPDCPNCHGEGVII